MTEPDSKPGPLITWDRSDPYWGNLESEGLLDTFVYEEIARRHDHSLREVANLKNIAKNQWNQLASLGSDQLGIPGISDRACIYVTGSLARFEATQGSDLDLFVVDHIHHDATPLNYIENAHLISSLDRIRLEAGFRPFSRGGEFVRTHSLQDIVSRTGSPDDDATNTFTARILLLVNSFPLLNEAAYRDAKTAVLDHYWRTGAPEARLRPIMLMNDIRRWWGVVGLNFEKYNPMKQIGKSGRYRTTAEREIANLKLRYARMLACYTPLLGFLALSENGGLLRSEVELVLNHTPVERLNFIAARAVDDEKDSRVAGLVDELLRAYDAYLSFIGRPKEELHEYFRIARRRRAIKSEAYRFHAKAAELMKVVGKDKDLLDYVLI